MACSQIPDGKATLHAHSFSDGVTGRAEDGVFMKTNQIQAGGCGFSLSVRYGSVLDSGQDAAWRTRKKSFRGRRNFRVRHTQQSVLVDFLHFCCKLDERSWLITAQLALPKTESSG